MVEWNYEVYSHKMILEVPVLCKMCTSNNYTHRYNTS